jgi:hypothetical protein
MQEKICIALSFFVYIFTEANKGIEMQKSKAVSLLENWFQNEGIRKNWFAKRLGTDSASISRWLSGKVRPHKPVRKRIEELTNGDVPMDAWE